MHGNYAPNVKSNECDVLLAVGMRFDDPPITPEETTKTGIITFFSEKGYGFITEDSSKENVFFHQNNCPVPLKKGNKVSFEKEKSAKGFSAINIQLVK